MRPLQEWLSSTPRHILLYRAFDWTPPSFVHLPLLLNADRSKLSKRSGDVHVEDYVRRGYLPEALVNFVALLGWSPREDGKEVMRMEELVEEVVFIIYTYLWGMERLLFSIWNTGTMIGLLSEV
ncbi:hypothetical protein BC938DRAFT_474547 [Jimgerdemannia flammicorona]|uniref:Glutamyl/glutaminyl-tRNA synthetase class Ib catalytic domain-containing protein n=1 Tax=Jimgerdemannia flammicorona TaxID=994334 RepID=A0A433Q241_9FUNG|nr:hypothetical protein BC938DRAFT_474547 [Jimgerdemannia flammicorona]